MRMLAAFVAISAVGLLTACSIQDRGFPGALGANQPDAPIEQTVLTTGAGAEASGTTIHHGQVSADLWPTGLPEMTERFLREFPFESVTLSDEGRIMSFTPLHPPAEGVIAPSPYVPISLAKFDGGGRLLSFEYASIACQVFWFGAWHCQNNACAPPKRCVLHEYFDPTNEVWYIWCECEVRP